MTLDEYMASKKSGFPAKKQPRKLESTEAPAGVRVDRNADGAGKTDEMYGMIFKAYDGKVCRLLTCFPCCCTSCFCVTLVTCAFDFEKT